MTERPILFSAPMVRAILSGEKTQTRRLVKDATGAFWDHGGWVPKLTAGGVVWCSKLLGESVVGPQPKLPADVGDLLWVREAWRAPSRFDRLSPAQFKAPGSVWYEASQAPRRRGVKTWMGGRYRHARHMPRWASRLSLRVTGLWLERLQEISETDALAEGIERAKCLQYPSPAYRDYVDGASGLSPKASFASLWNSLGGFWEANPWVWVIEFEAAN